MVLIDESLTDICTCGCRDDFMTIATTRPETLFGDVAIAVNPEV
jgi:valyl-tRNA synthetase